MPLLVLTGYPCAGKSTICNRIKHQFETIGYRNVVVVDDHLCGVKDVYGDFKKVYFYFFYIYVLRPVCKN